MATPTLQSQTAASETQELFVNHVVEEMVCVTMVTKHFRGTVTVAEFLRMQPAHTNDIIH